MAERKRFTQRNKPHRQPDSGSSRKHSTTFRAAIGTGLALAIAAGVGLHKAKDQHDPTNPPITPVPSATLLSPLPDNRESDLSMHVDEKGIDALINALDQRMGALHETLSTKLATADPIEREYILAPLDFYFKNARDHERNHVRATGTTALPPVTPGNPTTAFFITGFSGDPDVIAGFSPAYSSLLIRPPQDEINLYDDSITFHEITHAYEHAQRLTGADPVNLDSYLSLIYTPKPSNLLPNEVNAYARQIHMLNVLTDGELRSDTQGDNSVDLQWWRARLNARPDEDHHLANLIRMSDQLFEHQTTIDQIPDEFSRGIHDFIREPGETLYEFDDQGMVVPVDR